MSATLPIVPSIRAMPEYTATENQTDFPYGFVIQAAADLKVTRTRAGVKTVLTLNTHYTVTGVGSAMFGNVVTQPSQAGDKILVEGLATIARTGNVTRAGKFRSAVTDDELDRQTIWHLETRRLCSELEARFLAGDNGLAAQLEALLAGLGTVDPIVKDFASLSAATLVEVNEAVTHLRTAGYADPKDKGGGLYARVEADPGHPGAFQSDDGAWWELIALAATPFMFGGIGNATGASGVGADDTAAVQACFDYIQARGQGWAKLTGGRFRTIDTVRARDIHVDFDGGVIDYDGPRDRVAVEFGDAAGGTGVGRKNLLDIYVRSTVTSWADDGYVGVRLTDVNHCRISYRYVTGFTRGMQFYSINGFCAYNKIECGEVRDDKYGWSLTTDGSVVGANEFINENLWIGGRHGNTSATNGLGSAYGVLVEAINGGYQGQNNNRWKGTCFELAGGAPGDEREPFRFVDAGSFCSGENLRWEGGRGYFGRCIGTTTPVRGNNFQISLYADALGTMTPAFLNSGLSYGNDVRTTWWNLDLNGSADFDLNQCVSAYSATEAAVRGGLIALTTGSADGALFQNSITGRKDSIRIGGGRAIGFFASTKGGETFALITEHEDGFPGRIAIALYDADGARLTNVSPDAPHLIRVNGAALAWSAAYGGIYSASSDLGYAAFTVSPSVKSIRVHVSSGTNAAYVKKINLVRIGAYDNNRPVHAYSGLDGDMFARKASVDPSAGIVGRYGAGDIIVNAAPASGQPAFWQCATAGRLAAAWAISTAYTAGALVLNDTNKIYECKVAGTSAGSGGPTGTSASGIADNTVEWGYIGPLATFIAGPDNP